MLLLSNMYIVNLIIIFAFHGTMFSQSPNQYYHKNPAQVEEGKDVNISVTLFISDQIVSGMLFFRSKDQMSYQELPMQYVNGNWEADIHGRNIVGDGIEYLVILHKKSWGRISVPENDEPFDNPLTFLITQKQAGNKSQETLVPKRNINDRNFIKSIGSSIMKLQFDAEKMPIKDRDNHIIKKLSDMEKSRAF